MIIRIFAPSVPTKPLNDAQMRGAFLYIYVHSQNTLMERLRFSGNLVGISINLCKSIQKELFINNTP